VSPVSKILIWMVLGLVGWLFIWLVGWLVWRAVAELP
jgi:hypothetical protein